MGLQPATKEKRNAEIVKLKKTMTFKELAKKFNLSETRIKEIYYREMRKALKKEQKERK